MGNYVNVDVCIAMSVCLCVCGWTLEFDLAKNSSPQELSQFANL